MQSFKGYVLLNELARKVNKTNQLFYIIDVKKIKMGNHVCVLKSSLPTKYREIAEKECLDLEKYYSFTSLSLELGMCKCYFASVHRNKKLDFKKIGHAALLKLSDEFLENTNKGLTPFAIRTKDDEEYAKEIIQMQGLNIGFY